jgi:hypothetical protein
MISIGELQIPSSPRFLEQGPDQLLPHPTTLIFQQATVTGFRRGSDVMGQSFPLAARFEDVQNPIEDFPFVRPRTSGPRSFRQQGVKLLPLCLRHIGPVGLTSGARNTV